MPTILHIPVYYQPKNNIGLPEQRALHAILLGALQTTSPELATAVHDMRVKPFAQAMLPNKNSPMTSDAPWVWRVSWLDDTLVEPFWDGLTAAPPPDLCRQPVQFAPDAARREAVSYETLSETPSAKGFQVDFRTPTSFKQRYYDHPVPTPYHCFQSWWARWREFTPDDLSINVAVLDVVSAHLVVSYFNLRSEVLQSGQRLLIGGVGKMTFRAIQTGKINADWWQAISILAAFAPYCATGHKTAQGMGQTSVVALK